MRMSWKNWTLKELCQFTTLKNSSNANGYVWDKIVTGTGVTGYIARGDSKESYIEVVSNNNNNNNNNNQPASERECDIDGNGVVNSGDLYQVIKFLKQNSNGYDKKYDVNKDNKVNSSDLYQIILYLRQH